MPLPGETSCGLVPAQSTGADAPLARWSTEYHAARAAGKSATTWSALFKGRRMTVHVLRVPV